MIKELYPNVFCCEIPLPNNPLKALNSYVIKGEEESLIIDTGFNCKESQDVFFNNLQELKVDIAKSKVVITHLHSDHSGLAHLVYKRGGKIHMSRGDGAATKRMMQEENWQEIKLQLEAFGERVENNFFDSHPGKKYAPSEEFHFTTIEEGDSIAVGDYRLEVISVPGHTPDMINLYDPKHKIYFSGDHILNPITPNIGFWGFKYPVILNQYFKSLEKIYSLDIKLTLPSHRRIITDHKKRINELIAHHDVRLKEVQNILCGAERPMSVTEVAEGMSWRIPFDTWSSFPPPQKAFALGEAMSHLEFLVYQKKAVLADDEGILMFSAK
ncbi:MBL fold metallo-hydrolase [Alkaliphilus pronyensis]|uniref:MBL fold metallo-hydrolase n=1 Tax=Alkaliphilus pronyensis TaxID=1482732 RepID=A0A6I0F8G6_9FIRM|nr:MBL fold metallo-hydrolase [Alkaliphilus pronyensis]KAB3539010.1 MBL fold metallo-hydrolase [Alkaliphilus pronyensis]